MAIIRGENLTCETRERPDASKWVLLSNRRALTQKVRLLVNKPWGKRKKYLWLQGAKRTNSSKWISLTHGIKTPDWREINFSKVTAKEIDLVMNPYQMSLVGQQRGASIPKRVLTPARNDLCSTLSYWRYNSKMWKWWRESQETKGIYLFVLRRLTSMSF